MLRFILVMLYVSNVYGDDDTNVSKKWGMAWTLRSATTPYVTSNNDTWIHTYLPLFYYDGTFIFLNGNEAGVKLYHYDAWHLNIIGRHHFVDIPRHDSNYFSDDVLDMGIQGAFDVNHNSKLFTELLSDRDLRFRANLRGEYYYNKNDVSISSYMQASLKSSAYNSYYYGLSSLGNDTIGAGVMLEGGFKSRYYFSDSWYLHADASLTVFDKESVNAPTINSAFVSELVVGVGFAASHHLKKSSGTHHNYLRVAVGEATPSSFSQNITGSGARDLNHNSLVSLFYGYELSDSLLGSSVSSYLSAGYVHHLRSDVQDTTDEYVMAFKFYYQIEPWWLRCGLASGLSYIDTITYIEKTNLLKDGYTRESYLMHYLDLSFDVELNHIFGKDFNDLWFGYGLHHRSGVFESAKHFGNIKGGSNYNTLYLQYHFNL